MNAKLKTMFQSFLFGMCMGGLMAISIKYPVKQAVIDRATDQCKANLGLDEFKVGLSGAAYTVRCRDRKEFNLKN